MILDIPYFKELLELSIRAMKEGHDVCFEINQFHATLWHFTKDGVAFSESVYSKYGEEAETISLNKIKAYLKTLLEEEDCDE